MTKFHYLTNIVIYKGSPLEVFLTIGEDKDGNLFYNINKNNKTAERVSGTMVGGSAVIQADNSSTSDINVTLTEEKKQPDFLSIRLRRFLRLKRKNSPTCSRPLLTAR